MAIVRLVSAWVQKHPEPVSGKKQKTKHFNRSPNNSICNYRSEREGGAANSGGSSPPFGGWGSLNFQGLLQREGVCRLARQHHFSFVTGGAPAQSNQHF